MQRSFLEGLNLEKETIDKIMDENGKDIQREKEKTAALQTQLSEAQNTLKSFEGVDVAELQGKIATLTADLSKKDSEYKQQIADRDFNDKLAEAAKKARARDLKAVKPFLDLEALKASKNQDADIAAAFEAAKKDNSYLFDGEKPPKMVSFTSGANEQAQSDNAKANNALRSLYGKE